MEVLQKAVPVQVAPRVEVALLDARAEVALRPWVVVLVQPCVATCRGASDWASIAAVAAAAVVVAVVHKHTHKTQQVHAMMCGQQWPHREHPASREPDKMFE